jgi:hypothetical protein
MTAAINQKLENVLASLCRSTTDGRYARASVIAAWEEHDYEWLVAAGYLTQSDIDGEVA